MFIPLTIANMRMLARNRQALFWALAFPLIFVTIFGLFRLDEPPSVEILVIDDAGDTLSERLVDNLSALEGFVVLEREDTVRARKELVEGEANYLLIIPQGLDPEEGSKLRTEPVTIDLIYDRGNQTAGLVIATVRQFVHEVNNEIVRAPSLIELRPAGVQARQLTYFDFLLPGFVGMGVMTYAIIGLAATMAGYREQKILKRILVTPLKVRTFFASQITAFLLLSMVQALIIICVGVFVFGAHIYGNVMYILLLVGLANIIFLNLGFIVGGVAKNVRAADGMANAIALPMMFLSGTFFPKESLPGFLAEVVEYLPLSPLLDATRGIALEARPIWDFPDELAMLAVWILLSSVAAIRVFRFT